MTTFEKYQIILELYRGGMGFSRISKQTGFNKSTIVRCLKTHEPNRAALREANIAAQKQRYDAATKARQEAAALEAQRKVFLGLLRKRAKGARTPQSAEVRRAYYLQNKDRMKAQSTAYYHANRSTILQRYRGTEGEARVHRRRIIAAARKRHYVRHPESLVANNLRVRLHGFLTSKRKDDAGCGCSRSFLRAYLEARFTDGMTWGNYGTYWHVDHIRPVSSFDLSKIKDRREVNHYTNLQPMEARANMAKGARIPVQLHIFASAYPRH